MCVHRPNHTSLTVGRLLSKYSGNRSKVMRHFSLIFDVIVIFSFSGAFQMPTRPSSSSASTLRGGGGGGEGPISETLQ